MTICAYCGAPAVHTDHVVSKADRRRYGIARSDKRYQVPACFACNMRKLTRRLAPTTELAAELNALMSGARWQVWRGDDVPEVARMTKNAAMEELRTQVRPILRAAHHAYCRDTGCFDGDDISNPEIERAAMLVVARARAAGRGDVLAEAQRRAEARDDTVVTVFVNRLDDWFIAAAEALVARLEGEQG